jgi:tRNA(fMet)-specific endonuclease VapC
MPRAVAYLLDSSVCVTVLRQGGDVRRLPPPGRCLLSQITVAELWTGIEKGDHRNARAVRLENFLAGFTRLDFDEAAARAYGEIRAALEKRGRTIGPLDLLIAAHTHSVGATVLTQNFDEFNRVPGLKVLRWK